MTTAHPAKAQLVELDGTLQNPKSGGKTVNVQFNPESLKLSFSNQVRNNDSSSNAGTSGGGSGSGGGDQAQGTQGRQFVGTGTTKLAVQLWFDVNAVPADGERVDDVRRLTQEVVFFIRPQESPDDATKFLPPGIRFSWGSFIFDGLVDSIEETIEFFSPEGKPLRASIALGLSQQTILLSRFSGSGRQAGRGGRPAGTSPLAAAPAGSTLQGLAAQAGAGADWQAIASANGIDNPRQLQPGQLIDLQARPLPRLF